MAVAAVEVGAMADGFLGRWSRRKLDTDAGRPLAEPLPPQPSPPIRALQAGPEAELPSAQPPAAPAPALPTLADAESLSMDADFRPFVAREVAPEVRNLAFKKLFADPHFNVMDGLDTYIDDYTIPSPLPLDVLKRMASAQVLGLVEPEDAETPSVASVENVAQCGICNEFPSQPLPPALTSDGEAGSGEPASQTPDDHADLRLQPDDATPAPGAGRSTV